MDNLDLCTIVIHWLYENKDIESDTAPVHYLKTSFVEKIRYKTIFFAPAKLSISFSVAFKSRWPFHHFFIVFIYYWGGYRVTFNNISVTSWWSVLLVKETGVPGENHGPIASHWQTLSHNVVSSTPRHERDSNSQF